MKKLYRPVFSLVAAGVLLPVMAFRPAHTQATEPVSVWLTTGDQTKLLQAQAVISFSASTPATGTTITVDESQTYQTIDGFGASMTGASAYLLNRKMSAAQRDALLNDLFSTGGIHLSFLRHTMGGSDFSVQGDFTYDDKPQGQTDVGLSSFSIANDLVDLVPMLQAARAKNSSLKILGTPWSAPAWMKEPTAGGVYELRNGHFLNTAYYQAYANYFVKYVQAYAAQGVPIYAMTLQNEPLFAASYMSMRMDAGNQLAFLKNNIGPAFQSAGLSTKLIAYDHNWDQPSYPNTIFADATAARYAAGSAFHGYAGSVSGQSTTHNAYPAEDIWFTEISGTVGSSFAGDLKWHASNIIIGTTRNWAKSALEWNLALDQNNGPTNGGCTNCRGVVTINSTTGAVTRNVEYYALAHASKFVDPGAVRVGSNSVAGGIETVAFRNPDGSKVLIALNNSNASNTFKVSWNAQSFNYTLPAGALATYKWNTSDIMLGRIYEISAKHSGKALEIVGSSTSNGGQAQQRTWATSSNQKWKPLDMGNGFVRLVNIFSNKSLDVPGPSAANGALAQQWDWSSADSQAWLVQRQSDGTYRIINKYSNKALDVAGASQADGANAQQWDWTGADNQRWWFSDQGPAALTALAATGPAADARLQVYPTTINKELTFDYLAENPETLQVQLVDVLGRVALAPPAVAAKAGLNHISLDAGSATAGLYMLKVYTAAGPLSQRIIIAR
jgi:glucosylceramidase